MIYFSLALFASAYITLTGDNGYFWKAYFFFVFLFVIVLFSTNALRVLIKESVGNFGGICLAAFLSYYVVMAVAYPDTQISSNHLNIGIVRSIVPGLLTGFISFGTIGTLKVRELPRLSQRLRSALVNTPLFISLLLYSLVIALVVAAFLSVRRSDVFLITNIAELDDSYYQLFGTYALLAFIGALPVIYHYLKHRYLVFCAVTACSGFVFCTSLALAGSNKELIAIVMIVPLSIIYAKPKNYVFKDGKLRLKGLSVLLAVLLLAGAAAYYVSGIELPALRILDFQNQGSLLRNESLLARIDIIMETGTDQFLINPLFGNLGSEYMVGRPGGYIHSIISVQSHLGMTGSLLLLGYLVHRLYRLYANSGRAVLKMITPPILFVSAVGTFFTWLVLWFLLGALLAPRKDS